MRAIVEFRQSVYGPVLAEYNVAGRGVNHIQNKCTEWASTRAYGYWSIVYNVGCPDYDRIVTVNGQLTTRGV